MPELPRALSVHDAQSASVGASPRRLMTLAAPGGPADARRRTWRPACGIAHSPAGLVVLFRRRVTRRAARLCHVVQLEHTTSECPAKLDWPAPDGDSPDFALSTERAAAAAGS